MQERGILTKVHRKHDKRNNNKTLVKGPRESMGKGGYLKE
jgi:hypothetical protein